MVASHHDELIAELYASDLQEFTSARDALAKRLRAEGDRDGASQVKALRKPSVTAWAVNRVRHREPERVEELLAAGAQLRDAQERVIGSGGPGGLRDASARERQLVQGLVESAAAELAAVGHAVTPAIRSRVFATLHAAVGDDDARSLLAAGQLVRDYELSDLGLGLGLGFGLADAGTSDTSLEPSQQSAEPPAPSDQREQDIQAARERLEHATAERIDADEDLADAEDRLRHAALAVEQAEAALTHARQRSDAARARRDRADTDVGDCERALGELLP
jgi:hypothetical protein